MTRHVTTFSHAPNDGNGGSSRTWPRAAILDCDGLLVDTQACWQSAYRRAAACSGASLDGVDLRSLDGASTHSAAAQLSLALGANISAQTIAEALNEELTTQPLCPMPGAEMLLTTLAAHYPLAVASNAPVSAVVIALSRTGLERLIPAIVSAETAGVFKPNPDVYLRACRCLGVDPSDAVALEDSATGARAAHAARLLVVAVPATASTRTYADLSVPRLDDPRVFELFGAHVRR